MPSFFKQLALITLVVITAIVALDHFWPGTVLPITWYLLAYFVVITLATHALVNRGLHSDALDFSNRTMGATGIRLFVSAGILFYYYWQVKDQNQRIHFTITFFVLYFLFSGFEIQSLLSKLRRNSGKP